MDTTTQAQIYLADNRGCSRTPTLQSFHNFNFGSYRAEGREPFGALCLLNDDSLRANASLSLQVEEDTQVLILPVNGGLGYRCDLEATTPVTEETAAAGSPAAGFLEPKQMGLFLLKAGTRYTVSNPYEQETVDFLQIWLTSPGYLESGSCRIVDFDLSQANTLLPLVGGASTGPGLRVYIGQFEGRQDNVFTSRPDEPDIYVFVLQGAFEVANRLLHEKDGLSLRHLPDNLLAFEALSNGAVLLILTV